MERREHRNTHPHPSRLSSDLRHLTAAPWNMLAEFTPQDPSSVELAGWLICLVAIAVGYNAIAKAWDRLRGDPPTPPNDRLHHDHTTLARRVDMHTSDIEAIRRDIQRGHEEQDRKDSTHRASLYRKIEESEQRMRGEIKELRVENNTKMESMRMELSTDIKNMPMQVVALLKNTDAI